MPTEIIREKNIGVSVHELYVDMFLQDPTIISSWCISWTYL